MKSVKKPSEAFLALVVAAVLTSAAIPASAADLKLVGDSAAVWGSNSAIWTNSVAGGALVKFNEGDNILVSSDYFTGESLRMDARFNPGDVVFDIATTLKFGWGSKNTYGLGPGTKSFTKRGEGTLILTSALSGSAVNAGGNTSIGNGMTNGVEIKEGEIACKDRNSHNFLGPRMVPFWVYVRDGASLTFLEGNQTATASSQECGIKIRLDKGGMLNHITNAVSKQIASALPINTLMLNGGDIVNGVKAYYEDDRIGGKCMMKIYDTLWFSGDTPHAFGFNVGDFPGCKTYTPSGTFKGYLVSLNPYSPVAFRVDDITGDDGVDAYANMLVFTYGTNTAGQIRSDIIKTGAGTLCFPSNNCVKAFKGDFFVKEGTVEFKSLSSVQNFFQAGEDNPLQTITISTNATMVLRKRNITPAGAGTIPNIKFVVDHGKLTYDAEWGNDGGITAKDWVFDDATLDIRAAGMNERYGIFVFKNSATFRGTRPISMLPCLGLPANSSANRKLRDERQAVNVWIAADGKRTTFDVADITGDGQTDVTMGYAIWNGYTADRDESVLGDSGFVKIGCGTFSVASMTNKVTGVITVSNGTMRVDGKLVTPSTVDVAAGAFIGGTGTVARVSMDAGAGFDAPAGQDRPLTVQGDLALPATGVVNIANLDGSEERSMKPVNLVTATGDISGVENLAGWTVKVNGVTTRKWRLAVKNGVLGAKFNNGFVITFR